MSSFSSVIALSLVGCVSDPAFEQTNGSTTTSDPTMSTNADMVLVPATTLSKVATQDSKGKGKGKSGDQEDAPKPAPAPAPPAPDPGTTTGSTLVPAFWIDAAPVSPADYSACTSTGACSSPSCASAGDTVACITHAQASSYCAWASKRLVRDAEWSAAVKQRPTGLIVFTGDFSEWVDAAPVGPEEAQGSGIARGGATPSASLTLGLDSSIPTVGFRCARDR